MERYDALIVGGSLAGATAGILLSKAGWKVGIFEKALFPRQKVCGEFLSPGAWPLLESLGLTARILSLGGTLIEKARFISRSTRTVEVGFERVLRSHPRHGYGISRKNLDLAFLSHAEACGARVLAHHDVRGIERKGSRFLIEVSNGRSQPSGLFESRWVINAAGRFNRWRNGEKSEAKADFRKICFKAHFTTDHLEPVTELVFFKEGYLGTVAIEGGLANLCGTVSEVRMRQAQFDFDQLLRDLSDEQPKFRMWLGRAERITEWFSCGPERHEFRTGYRDGIFFVGDAACSLEPFMGQGMTLSIASSILLSVLLGESRRGDLEQDAIGALYHRKLRLLCQPKLILGKILAALVGTGNAQSELGRRLVLLQPFLPFFIRKSCEAPELGWRTYPKLLWS